MFVSRCSGCTSKCDGSEKQGAVLMVRIKSKLASVHGLGRYAMLEGSGCPKGGIGVGVVK